MGNPKTVPSKARLEELYATRSVKEIAEELCVAPSTVLNWLRWREIPVKPPGRRSDPLREPSITISPDGDIRFDCGDGRPLYVSKGATPDERANALLVAWSKGAGRER